MPSPMLAEIFGFPYDNLSHGAERHRRLKLCPYHNKVPSCTKNSATSPLGVCSIFHDQSPVITCPMRFREDWRIIEDAAGFFFEPDQPFTSLAEIRLNDADGNSAGNIDFVLVSLDDDGNITDFGALEVQAVYISGNVSKLFSHYLKHRHHPGELTWPGGARPDYLSSSRKRLIPQLIYKGKILRTWKKKLAVVLQKRFYETLPPLPPVSREKAEIAWLIYDLEYNTELCVYQLKQKQVVHTRFQPALERITTPRAGDMNDFMALLQKRLEDSRPVYPAVNFTLTDTAQEE